MTDTPLRWWGLPPLVPRNGRNALRNGGNVLGLVSNGGKK